MTSTAAALQASVDYNSRRPRTHKTFGEKVVRYISRQGTFTLALLLTPVLVLGAVLWIRHWDGAAAANYHAPSASQGSMVSGNGS